MKMKRITMAKKLMKEPTNPQTIKNHSNYCTAPYKYQKIANGYENKIKKFWLSKNNFYR